MDDREQKAFWDRWYYLESPIKEIEVIDSAARQLITITAFLQGIYFAAISLSDFKKQAATWQLAILLIPAVLWLVSLVLAVVTFMPATRRIKRDSAREDLIRIRDAKYCTLRASFYVLLASLAVLLVDVVIYLRWIPSAPTVAPGP